MNYLHIYNQEQVFKLTRKRAGETKLGECIQTLHSPVLEKELENSPAAFVLLGLPEDIGVRANYGRGGTHTAWQPALTNILNLQSNNFFTGKELLVLGHIDFDDLMQEANVADSTNNEGMQALRKICAAADARVTAVIKQIVVAGKIPIIIGGGHNNAYGNIKGTAEGLFATGKIKHKRINCINCDAHSDFRALEGRHSGNGFSYAYSEGYLASYGIVGLHENYNSGSVLEELKKQAAHIQYSLYEDIFIHETLDFKQAVMQSITFIDGGFAGIELDMDAIQNIPASAKTPSGISTNQARQYVTWCAQNLNAAYLHIAEAAPILSPIKTDRTGKLIAYLVSDFIKACIQK